MKKRKKKKSTGYIRNVILYSFAFLVSLINFRKLYALTLIFFALIVINVIYLVRSSEPQEDYSPQYDSKNTKLSHRAKRDYEKRLKQQYNNFLEQIDEEFDFDYEEEEDEI